MPCLPGERGCYPPKGKEVHHQETEATPPSSRKVKGRKKLLKGTRKNSKRALTQPKMKLGAASAEFKRRGGGTKKVR